MEQSEQRFSERSDNEQYGEHKKREPDHNGSAAV
jgi:hypothetical protein